jgi:hypothetical protein
MVIAKHQLKKKMEKDKGYMQSSKATQTAVFAKLEEELDERRFRAQSSGKLSHYLITVNYLHALAEWLEGALKKVHSKWDAIQVEIDMRQHQSVLGKRKRSENDEKKSSKMPRPLKHLLGIGGAIEQIERVEYFRGLELLQKNGFKSPAEKQQWVEWRDNLEPDLLARLTDEQWQ